MFTVDFGGDDSVFEQGCRMIGEAIARGREDLEMTPEELARVAHVSPLTVRRVEAGELAPFTVSSIIRIAAAVDIVVDFDIVPKYEELLVLAASTEKPIRVLAPATAPDLGAEV